MQLLGPLGMGIAVYTGIRIDLAIAKAKAEQAFNTANHAHGRIDRLMERNPH